MEDRGGYIWVPWKEWLHDSAGVVNPRWGIALPAPYIVDHHTPGIDPPTLSAAIEALNGVWYYHTFVAEGGWGWIGYNTIGWGRYIFEGAGLGNRGIHAPGANGQSHGHAFLLDSRIRQPVQEEWSAYRAVITDAVGWGYLQEAVLLDGNHHTFHSDWVGTECPADGVRSTKSRFYNTSPNPNPDPNPKPERRKGGKMIFKVRMAGSVPAKWSGGNFGIQWESKVYDCWVPAGYKVGVVPTSQLAREFTCSMIVNGQQQPPKGVRLDQPYIFEVTADSFITVCVPYDQEPNISVG